MSSIDHDFRALCQKGISAGPVSIESIRNAETVLGVEFPAHYIEFLKEFGAVLLEGVEIFGLVDPGENDPPMWQDVVDVTIQLRGWNQAGSERKNFIPISEDGTGVYYYLETGQANVSNVWAVGQGVEKMVAENLHQFTLNSISGKLES